MRVYLIVLLILSNCFGVDSIYTWGYGDALIEILKSISTLSRDGNLYFIAISIGLFVLVIRVITSQINSMQEINKFIFLIAIFCTIYTTNRNYLIVDEVTNKTYTAQNVPTIIGETLYIFNQLERGITKAFVDTFSTVNSMNMLEYGIGFNMSAHINSTQLKIKDPYLVNTFNTYMSSCIANALIQNSITARQVIYSDNLIETLNIKNNYFETVVYNNQNPRGLSKNCQDVWEQDIAPNISSLADTQLSFLAKKMDISQEKLSVGLSDTTKLLFNASKSAQDYISQQTLINMTKEGLVNMSIASGGKPQQMALGSAIASANQKTIWTMTGILAQDNLPILKSVITLVLIGIAPMFILLTIALNNLQFLKILFILLISLLFWTPTGAIINYLVFLKLEDIIGNTGTILDISKSLSINSTMSNYMAFLFSAMSLIPIFAYGIVKGSEYAFSSFFSSIGSNFNQVVSQPANEISLGNLNIGNTKIGSSIITDDMGTHTQLGNNMLKNEYILKDFNGNSMVNMSYGRGKDGYTTTKSSYGEYDTNNDGFLTKFNGNFNNTLAQSASYQETIAHQKLLSAQESFGTSAGNSITTALTNQSGIINDDRIKSQLGISEHSAEIIEKSLQKSIRNHLEKIDKYDKKLEITNDKEASIQRYKENEKELLNKSYGPIICKIEEKDKLSIKAEGKKHSGEAYIQTFQGEDAKAIINDWNNNISNEIKQDKSLANDLSKTFLSNEHFSNSKTQTDAQEYQNLSTQAQTWSDINQIMKSSDIRLQKDITPQIINNFIGNDDILSHRMANANDNDTKIIIYNEAIQSINNALMSNTGADYQNILQSIKDVTGNDKPNINNQIKDTSNIDSAIATGKKNIDSSKINNIQRTDLEKDFIKTQNNFQNVANDNMQQFIKHNQPNINTQDIQQTKKDISNEHTQKQDEYAIITGIKGMSNKGTQYEYTADNLFDYDTHQKELSNFTQSNSKKNETSTISELDTLTKINKP